MALAASLRQASAVSSRPRQRQHGLTEAEKVELIAAYPSHVLNRLLLFVFPILLPLGKFTDSRFALDAIDHHDARQVIYLMLKNAA